MPANINAKLDAARLELLDLSLRNPLLNYRARKRTVEVVDEVSREVCRIIVGEGHSMTFRPLPKKVLDVDGGQLEDLFADETTDWASIFSGENEGVGEDGMAARHVDTKLQTRLDSPSLHARLLAIHNDARTYIEEQGVNILYLALGFLHWYDAKSSEQDRRAPLILVPVELTRTSATDRFHLSCTSDEIGTNLSLYEKLKTDFDMTLPAFDNENGFDIDQYFEQVEQKVAEQLRWSVSPNEIALGFFSFGKFLMYKDLEDAAWPAQKRPSDHSILASLLGDGFSEVALIEQDDVNVDEIVSPDDMCQVLDADSSQILAILDVMSGRNMVVQGPPGTGKSQTITNILAECIAQGKKVLFVSEKMAALEVVKRRLDGAGLGDAVLELHSHKTNKRILLKELERTLHLGRPTLGNVEDDIQALVIFRNRLNEYCEAVNTPILKTRRSPVTAVGCYLALGDDAASLPQMDFSRMRDWSAADYGEQRLRVEEMQRRLESIGVPRENPFWGVRKTALLPSDENDLRQLLIEGRSGIHAIRDQGEVLAKAIGLDSPDAAGNLEILCRAAIRVSDAPNLAGVRLDSGDWLVRRDDLKRLIDAGTQFSRLHERYDAMLIPEAWDQDLLLERQHYVTYGRRWWRWISGNYRRSRTRLAGLTKHPPPKDIERCIELIDAILDERREEATYCRLEDLGANLFGERWQRHDSDWPTLSNLADWILRLHEEIGEGGLPGGIISFLAGSPELVGIRESAEKVQRELKIQCGLLTEIQNKLQLDMPEFSHNGDSADELAAFAFSRQLMVLDSWIEQFDKLALMVRFNLMASELQDNGLEFVLPHIEAWREAPRDLVRAFDASWYHGLIEVAITERPAIRKFDRVSHEYVVGKFCELDRLIFKHNRRRLAEKHWKLLPNLEGGGELAVIRREINKKRRHIPIRRLINESGRAIQNMKPVFMMSPMSIANFLTPGQTEFEVVVFDEASQVKPVDAFGAVLRGQQVVVVGDSKQLPPTSFFDVLSEVVEEDDSEDNSPADAESILGLFLAQNAPERMLRWHYRSRHDSLIAVSNHEFYDDRLVVFPSPGRNPQARGLLFRHLPDTHYDRGRTRSNPEEAKAVAEAVMRHAGESPDLTLGVAAFSTAQRDAIAFQLEFLRRKDPSCEGFFSAHLNEPFFVKNLENVQGDERDVIFISIGYGRTKEGYLSMNFGPLNRDGGERRLNVLITRARCTCEVFANFTAADLDLSRVNKRGVVALRNFLAYACDGILEQPYETDLEVESPFEAEVLRSLTALGYRVVPQVGSAGFRIDLGVRDEDRPGRYLLGIECDGATYHSARSARDRDRLRQEVLENLGWRIHRIWSSDWFRDRNRELERAVEAIEKAKVYWAGIGSGGDDSDNDKDVAVTVIDRTEETQQGRAPLVASQYRECSLYVKLAGNELHELSAAELADYVREVVDIEGPVHTDVVVQRITSGAGLQRTGARIRNAVTSGIRYGVRKGVFGRRKSFLWPASELELRVRDRSSLNQAGKNISQIPPEEILLALVSVVTAAFSIDRDAALGQVLDLLGFRRATAKARSAVGSVLDQSIADGKIFFDGRNVTLV